MNEDLFTIILSNYNQDKYIFEALDTILSQKYKNIELIISDDNSKVFPMEKLKLYIAKSRPNIKLSFVVNEVNMGTVATYNKCLRMAKGKYITFIAADDKYHDDNVINNYVKKFKENDKIEIVTSITHLYDDRFNKKHNTFPFKEQIKYFDMSASEQNTRLFSGPFFAPGATAYKNSLFKKLNYFDSIYYLIEDWSFFLRMTRSGIKVYFADFVSLLHRGGGISESDKIPLKIHKAIINDTQTIYDKEIFPYFNKLDEAELRIIMDRFRRFVFYNKRFNWKIFLDYLRQIIFNSKYRWILMKKRVGETIATLITLIIMCIYHQKLDKIHIIILPVFIYLFVYIIFKIGLRLSRKIRL